MSDVYLKYVGKKPTAIDSICGTGVVWNGNGDIKPIADTAAEKLLKHPDQWELVTLKEALKREQEKPIEPVTAPVAVMEPFDDGFGETDTQPDPVAPAAPVEEAKKPAAPKPAKNSKAKAAK